MYFQEQSNCNLASASKGAAELISHARLNSFSEILAGFIADYCRYDELSIFARSGSQVPVLLHPRNVAQRTPLMDDYLNGEYLMDPSMDREKTFGRSVYRLADLYAGGLVESQFYQRYYHNIGYVDEVLMQVTVNADTRIIISLGRKPRLGRISRREMQSLHDIYPLVAAAVQQFWMLQGDAYNRRSDEHPVEDALQSFGRGILTQREREISTLILKGYSSKSIARSLDISVDTVKVHRRNIHSRLKTSTQSDLFNQFLGYLEGMISRAA